MPNRTPVATYVSSELAEAIDQAAEEQGLSRAAFVRTTLLRCLRNQALADDRPELGGAA